MPLGLTLQPFGHNSVIYEVVTPSQSVILRINSDPKVFQRNQSNLKQLTAMELPVSEFISSDYSLSKYPFAYTSRLD